MDQLAESCMSETLKEVGGEVGDAGSLSKHTTSEIRIIWSRGMLNVFVGTAGVLACFCYSSSRCWGEKELSTNWASRVEGTKGSGRHDYDCKCVTWLIFLVWQRKRDGRQVFDTGATVSLLHSNGIKLGESWKPGQGPILSEWMVRHCNCSDMQSFNCRIVQDQLRQMC